jgi:hypothetical protein
MPLLAYISPAPTRQATTQQQSNHHQSYTLLLLLLLLNAALSSTTTMDATPEHAWRTLSSWQAAAEGGCN